MTWSYAKPVGTRANFEIRNVSVHLRYSLASAFVQRHPTHITLFQSEKAIDREKSSYNCFDTFICKHSVMMYRFLGNSVKMLLKQLCYLNLSCRVHANKDIKTIVRFVKPLFSSKLWLYVNQSVLPTNGKGLLHVNEKDCIKIWKECSITALFSHFHVYWLFSEKRFWKKYEEEYRSFVLMK